MASGLEIAGLVLAAFPLVIKGLGCYIDGVETMILWRRYRRQLADYQRQIETQRIWYLDTLEELLDGIVGTDAELTLLVADPGGVAWQKPEYDRRLRTRLDHSYEPYIATIRNLLDALQTIKEKLGLDASGKVTWDTAPSLKREVQRLKTVLSKSVYEELFTTIHRDNKDLREFTHQNRYLEAVRHKRRGTRQHSADFKKIRRSARSLHHVVIGGESWKCSCRHVAYIRLEPQAEDYVSNASRQPTFRIILSCKKKDTTSKWQEIEVKPTETTAIHQDTVQSISLTVQNTTASTEQGLRSVKLSSKTNTVPAKATQVRKTAKTVRFIESNLSSTSIALPMDRLPSRLPITDICSALHSDICTSHKCIGFLTHECASSITHRHDVFFLGSRVDPQPQSLESLLTSWKQVTRRTPTGPIFFSRRERLFIAASLASSVLQLDGSWLKKRWSSRDVYFLPSNEPATNAFYHPYLSSEVLRNDSASPCTTSSRAPSPTVAHVLHDEVLLPLGLTLMELSLGQTSADLEKAEGMDHSETMRNLRIALSCVYDESGLRYGDVVRKCLFWPFDSREPTLDDDDFRNSILELIVMPLIEDWKAFEGSP